MARPKLEDPRSEVIHFRLSTTEAQWMDDLVRRESHPNRTSLLRALLYAAIEESHKTPDSSEGDLYDE